MPPVQLKLRADLVTRLMLEPPKTTPVEVEREVERRVARWAGPGIHLLFEFLFCLLPAFLLYHMARNFFYEHLWLKQPLLGFDFFFDSGLTLYQAACAIRGGLIQRFFDIAGMTKTAQSKGFLLPDSPLGTAFCFPWNSPD